MKKEIGFSLCLCLMLYGCNEPQNKALEQKASELTEKVLALETRLGQVESRLDQVDTKQGVAELLKIIETTAFIKTGSSEYQPVKFELGYLTVALRDIKPYANGSKVTLSLGNPTAARIDGLKAKLAWGRVDEKGNADNSTAKEKEITFSETLHPGSWNSVSVVLDGVPANELGFIRVSDLSHTKIFMTLRY